MVKEDNMSLQDWPVHTDPKEKFRAIMRRSKIHVVIKPEDVLDIRDHGLRRRIKWPLV